VRVYDMMYPTIPLSVEMKCKEGGDFAAPGVELHPCN